MVSLLLRDLPEVFYKMGIAGYITDKAFLSEKNCFVRLSIGFLIRVTDVRISLHYL